MESLVARRGSGVAERVGLERAVQLRGGEALAGHEGVVVDPVEFHVDRGVLVQRQGAGAVHLGARPPEAVIGAVVLAQGDQAERGPEREVHRAVVGAREDRVRGRDPAVAIAFEHHGEARRRTRGIGLRVGHPGVHDVTVHTGVLGALVCAGVLGALVPDVAVYHRNVVARRVRRGSRIRVTGAAAAAAAQYGEEGTEHHHSEETGHAG